MLLKQVSHVQRALFLERFSWFAVTSALSLCRTRVLRAPIPQLPKHPRSQRVTSSDASPGMLMAQVPHFLAALRDAGARVVRVDAYETALGHEEAGRRCWRSCGGRRPGMWP